MPTGKEIVEKARAAGYDCEYADGRPLFHAVSEAQRQEIHKWMQSHYGRTYAVYGSREKAAQVTPAEVSIGLQEEALSLDTDDEAGWIAQTEDIGGVL